jgi:hypothetical protein
MKRAGIICLAIVFSLGLGVAATHAAPKVKVESDVYLNPDNDYDDDTGIVTVYGDVSAKRRKCERRRDVTLRQVDQDLIAGTDKTDDSGDYAIEFSGIGAIDTGNFQAKAAKRKIKKRKNGEVVKTIICKAASSPVEQIPPDPL